MFQFLTSLFREQVVKRLTRSSKWPKVRRDFLLGHPNCAVCSTKASQVHHIKPFHIHPELELDPKNLISFCPDHHLLFGHLLSWKSFNIDVEKDAKMMYDKIKTRPTGVEDENDS